MSSPAAVHVPDGASFDDALARTTDLGIGAHPDDLELSMLVPIGECFDRDDRWFTGIVCTDGAGSARSGAFASHSDAELVGVRSAEQRRAADVGCYSAVVQLGHPSGEVRAAATRGALVDELADLVERVVHPDRPLNVYTHNLADKHPTHAAVALAVVEAFRRLPAGLRSIRLVGVEGWRDLDWLPDHEKVLLDASAHAELGARLAACFPSQIAGGKRYDLAVEGRRRANATMRDPRAVDGAEQVSIAMDLTSLIRNHDLDPVTFATAAVDRFRAEVEDLLRGL